MKKYLFSLIFLSLVLFVLPKGASAQGMDDNTLRHAYKPYVNNSNGTMTARVDNYAPMWVKRLVCVEATRWSDGMHQHLGCLWISLDANHSSGNWAAEFNAPTNWLGAGTWTVAYTYQGSDGMWHHIWSVNLTNWDGMVTH